MIFGEIFLQSHYVVDGYPRDVESFGASEDSCEQIQCDFIQFYYIVLPHFFITFPSIEKLSQLTLDF